MTRFAMWDDISGAMKMVRTLKAEPLGLTVLCQSTPPRNTQKQKAPQHEAASNVQTSDPTPTTFLRNSQGLRLNNGLHKRRSKGNSSRTLPLAEKWKVYQGVIFEYRSQKSSALRGIRYEGRCPLFKFNLSRSLSILQIWQIRMRINLKTCAAEKYHCFKSLNLKSSTLN